MQFEFADATANVHKEVMRRVEACLETGNFDQARIIMVEYEDVHPIEACNLRAHLIPNYNVSI